MIFVKDMDSHIAPEATSVELQLFVHKINSGNIIESSSDEEIIVEGSIEENPTELEAVADKFTIDFK